MRFLVAFLVCPLLACTAVVTTQAQSVSDPNTASLPDAPVSHLSARKTSPAKETDPTLPAANAERDASGELATSADASVVANADVSLDAGVDAGNDSTELSSVEIGLAGFQRAGFGSAELSSAEFSSAEFSSAGFSSAGFSSSSLIEAFQSGGSDGNAKPDGQTVAGSAQKTAAPPADEEQPKRILGLMPNYRAVSAGVRPPPPGPKESFIIATENNFDYSQFVFVGLTSLLAEGTNTHPEFGKGAGGYWSYYWRGYIDKSDGDYLIIFAFPTLFHEDERYFAMGQGGFWKRAEYSGMSVFITPNYHGKNVFNWAEILGRGVSQAVSLTYYPSEVSSPSSYFSKFGYAVGRDALTNVFREFYPDMARVVFKPFHKKKTNS